MCTWMIQETESSRELGKMQLTLNSWKTSEEEDLDKLNLSNSEKSEERISFIMMDILNFYFF